MAYKYDVFLSYLHEKPCGTWVSDHFLPYFQHQLGNALGGINAQIFYDRTGIQLGNKWPATLKQALAKSKCLVAIWSPKYFHSDWCRAECAIMRHREAQIGMSCNSPQSLIAPVKVNDGIHFPPYAQNRQYDDFEDVFYDGPGFTQSPHYLVLQRKIANFSVGVAQIANQAPPWSPDWETVAWTDDVIAAMPPPQRPNVPQPLLTP